MFPTVEQQRVLQAWQNDDLETFKTALQAPGVNVNLLYREEGFSTLLEVISSDHRKSCEDFIQVAIQHGAQVNLRNAVLGRTALHAAVQALNPIGVRALLEAGASVQTKDDKGNNCLHLLARKVTANAEERQMRCLDLLLEVPDVPLNEFNEQGLTPVLAACKRGAWKMVARLLEEGNRLDIDTKSDKKEHDKTAREEISERRPDLISLLPTPSSDEQEPISMDGEKLFKFLYEKHENRFCAALTKEFDNRNQNNLLDYHDNFNTFLQFAVANKLYKAAKALLLLGADINDDKPRGQKPLHLACESGDSAMLRILLDHDVDLQPDSTGQTALHLLAKVDNFTEGHAECFKRVLAKNPSDVNSPDYVGKTPLHYAAEFPNTKVLNLLLDAGACIFAEDYSNQYAFTGIPEETLENYLDSKVSWNGLRCNDCKLFIDVEFLKPLKRVKQGKKTLLNKHFTAEPEMNGLAQLSNTPHLKHLISHPVITAFIMHKWSLIRPFYYLELFLFSIYYFLFTFYVFLTTTKYVHDYSLIMTLKVILFLFLALRYIQTILAAAATPYGFAKNPQRWINAIFTIISTIVLAKDVSSELQPPWVKLFPIFTCSALTSAGIQFKSLLAEHPKISLTVSIIIAMVRRCILVFLSYFSIILTFKVVFAVLIHYHCRVDNCTPFSLFIIPLSIPIDTTNGISIEENSMVMFTVLSIVFTAMIVNLFALAVIDCQNLINNSQFSTLHQQIKLISALEETLISSPRNRWKHLTKYVSRELKPPSGYLRIAKRVLFFSKSNTNLVVFPNRDTTLTTAVVKNKPQAWWNARARLKPKTVLDLEKRIKFESEVVSEENTDDRNEKKVDSLLEGVRQVSARLEGVEETGKQTERLLIQSLAIASLQNEKN